MDNKLGKLVSNLTLTNIHLWHEEDKARSVDDHEIASAKRNIDSLNQKRNDLIEKIDEYIKTYASGKKKWLKQLVL